MAWVNPWNHISSNRTENQEMTSRAEKDAVLDFAKYCDQRVRVRFQGGREVDGVLKGFDKLDNLVLEDAVEFLRGDCSVCCMCFLFFLCMLSCVFQFSQSRRFCSRVNPKPLSYVENYCFCLDPNDPTQVTENTRKLGQVVCRGTQVSLICPSDEMEEIANPFAEEEEEGVGEAQMEETA